jgi:hypothetical protein
MLVDGEVVNIVMGHGRLGVERSPFVVAANKLNILRTGWEALSIVPPCHWEQGTFTFYHFLHYS